MADEAARRIAQQLAQPMMKPGPAPTGRDKVFDAVYGWMGGKPASRWAADKITDVATLGGMAPWTAAYDGAREMAETGRPAALATTIMPGARVMAPVAKLAEKAATKGIRAFHGSPHDFDKFDLSKIGTGEGAQAYGHGLYFAESEGVARSYRDKLEVPNTVLVDGRRPSNSTAAAALDIERGNIDAAIASVQGDLIRAEKKKKDANGFLMNALGRDAVGSRPEFAWMDEYRQALLMLQRMKADGAHVEKKAPGRMYEVNIKANPDDFLDWDKPLSEQSEKVRGALNNVRQRQSGGIRSRIAEAERTADNSGGTPDGNDVPGRDVYNSIARSVVNGDWGDPGDFARQLATRELREAGIPGIRYLDQGSRGAGEGSRNYVAFDDSLIEILRKYGLLPPAAVGGVAATQSDPAQASP